MTSDINPSDELPSDEEIMYAMAASQQRGPQGEQIRFIKEWDGFKGIETVSDLGEYDRVNHVRMVMRQYLDDMVDLSFKRIYGTGYRETYREYYGASDATDEQKVARTLSVNDTLKEKDLLLRVSNKRKGRLEVVDIATARPVMQQQGRKWYQFWKK